jgi:hypothetical protein
MKARRVALLAVGAAAVAGLVWRRRRSPRTPEPAVQLGLADGSVLALDPTDPATGELQGLAAGVRGSFTGGA